MKKIVLVVLCMASQMAFSQNIRNVNGMVKDSLGNVVIAASVKLISPQDTLRTITDLNGFFLFKGVKSADFTISISEIGYKSIHQHFSFDQKKTLLSLPSFTLQFSSELLGEVVISGTPPITLKEDTVVYRAKDYQLRKEATTEDLLKKLQGISVDNHGNITAQGQAIAKVRINGKDYFGGDIKTATQNLPAQVIEKLRVVDDYGDQANITKVKNGDPDKVLDIYIKPEINKGYVLKTTLGLGSRVGDYTDPRYQASTAGNFFHKKEQFSFIENFNNTNTPSFSLDVGNNNPTILQNGGIGAMNSGKNTPQAAGQAPPVASGITQLGSFGLNYKNDFGKKTSVYGSYSYSNPKNALITHSVQQTNYQGQDLINTQSIDQNIQTTTHRFNGNWEYRIDTLNYLKISPTIFYNINKTNTSNNYTLASSGSLPSNSTNLQNSDSKNPSIGGNILYNHRFKKDGRNFSVMLTLNYSNTNQHTTILTTGNLNLNQLQKTLSNNSYYYGNVSYLEPIDAAGSVELNYTYYRNQYTNDRRVDDVVVGVSSINTAQTNNFDYFFTSSRIGLNYRVNKKHCNYFIGLSLLPSVLASTSSFNGTTRYRSANFDIFPYGRFSYSFSKTKMLTLGTFGKRSEPSYTQLLPVLDQSNPQFPIQGNPYLKAAFNQMFRLRYNSTDLNTGYTLFSSLSGIFTKDKIVTNTVKSTSGTNLIQQTNYLNASGYYNLNAFCLLSKAILERKYVFSASGSVSYNNNISYVDGQKNIGKNWVFNPGFYIQINPKPWLEINPGGSYTYNTNKNDVLTASNNQVSSWSLTFNSKLYIKKTWLIGSDISKTSYTGYANTASNPFIINLYVEKQFFKDNTGALRIAAFDLLDQNTNISHTISTNTISDSQTSSLSRYFILTFSMRLQQFTNNQNKMLSE